jgi:hypothetical protein
MYHLQTGSYVQYNGTWFIALTVNRKSKFIMITNPTQEEPIMVPKSDLCVSQHAAELIIGKHGRGYLQTLKSHYSLSLATGHWEPTTWFNKSLAVTSKPKQLQLAL